MIPTTTACSQESSITFDQLVEVHGNALHIFCQRTARSYNIPLLLDGDDLYVVTLGKIWMKYFSKDGTAKYEHRSDQETLALLKRIASNTAIDEWRRRIKDFTTMALDATVGTDDSDMTLQDFISSQRNTADEVEAKIRFEEAIQSVCDSSRSPAVKAVTQFMLGLISYDDVADLGYSAGAIRTTISRVSEKIMTILSDQT